MKKLFIMVLGVQTLFCSEPNGSANQQVIQTRLALFTNAPGVVSSDLVMDENGVSAIVETTAPEERPSTGNGINTVLHLSSTYNGVTLTYLSRERAARMLAPPAQENRAEQNAASEGVAERSHNPSPPDGGPDVNSGSTRND